MLPVPSPLFIPINPTLIKLRKSSGKSSARLEIIVGLILIIPPCGLANPPPGQRSGPPLLFG